MCSFPVSIVLTDIPMIIPSVDALQYNDHMKYLDSYIIVPIVKVWLFLVILLKMTMNYSLS